MESHQNEALENAERILGEDCWAQTGDASASDVSDWLTVQRGRDLFLPGWGGFDVPEAFHACQAAGVKGIPSVAELRSLSYYVSMISLLLSLSSRQNIHAVCLSRNNIFKTSQAVTSEEPLNLLEAAVRSLCSPGLPCMKSSKTGVFSRCRKAQRSISLSRHPCFGYGCLEPQHSQ